jgi:FkbM family methyltransferase
MNTGLDTGLRRWGRFALTAGMIGLLARRTPYLETELLGLSSIVAPGSVCVDVGAAAGIYTVALSRLAGRTGQIHSVEPLTFVHPLWTKLLRAGDLHNVRRHGLALGAEAGTGMMSVPVGRRGPVTGRSFLAWQTHGRGSNDEFAGHIDVRVDVETLDGLCANAGLDRLDFVKIDVEGAELLVLQGGRRCIERYQPTILLEIEARHTTRYQHTPDAVVAWLVGRGYTMHVWQHGWRLARDISADCRNYLFRPEREQHT